MNDRELLELAAKAAGIQNYTMSGNALFVETGVARGDSGYYWKPLTDDGDALRLAVFCAQLYGFYRFLRTWVCTMKTEHGDPADPCAATRRAITRAAAEIGRSMP